jgi:hypothetical protein
VRVGVHQEHGSIGHDLVEQLAVRSVLAEHRRVPAAAEDPGGIRVRVRVRADPLEVVVDVVEVVEVHVAADATGEGRVDVRVLESRHDARAGQHLARVEPFLEIGLGADADDPIAGDRDGARPRANRVDGVDVAHDDEVRTLRHDGGR